jgi:hypothetical protein
MITMVMCVCWLIAPLVYLFTSPLGWSTSWQRFGLGSWRQFSARERALLNDELAQAHRHTAVAVAFCIGLAGLAAGSLSVFGLFVLPAWWPIALISLCGSAGAFAFGLLDLRSKGEAE